MTTRRSALHGLAAGALSLGVQPLLAQDDKSAITLLVGAGGSVDAAARIVAEHLREALGRPVVVSLKLGAGQRLALGEARRAAPDGRTLVFSTSGPFAIYPHIYNKLDYDPVADFTPVTGVSSFDVAIATSPQTGATTLRQLVDWARAHGDTPYASPGNGSLSHFVGIALGLNTGLKLTHVPYKAMGVGVIDLAAGRVPMAITGVNSFVELHKAGKIRILAVSGDARSPGVPEVPTLKEAGFALSGTTSVGIFGPRGLPPETVRRIHAALAPLLVSPAGIEKLAGQTMTPWAATAAEMTAAIALERKYYEGLVRASGYQKEDA